MPATLSASVTQELPLSQIKPNPNNPRRVITPEMIDNMAASLKSVGLKNPIKVIALPDGTHEVVSGHIRLAGATQLGWETIPATILLLTREQALLEAILDNRGQQMSWLETYMAAESLFAMNPNLTQQEVADSLGMPRSTVSRAMSLLTFLTPASRESICRNPTNSTGFQLSENAVFTLTTLGNLQKVEEALKVAIDQKMTEPQAKKLVESMKAGTPAEAYTPAKATAKVKTTSPGANQALGRPGTAAQAEAAKPSSANTASSMSETETLIWSEAAGISIISRIKAKIKKGERPSFFEALLLTGHNLWKIAEWLGKHAYRIAKPVVKTLWKIFKESLRSALKALGPTVYRITRTLLGIAFLAVCAWVVWDTYVHGFHPLHALSTLFTLVAGIIRG